MAMTSWPKYERPREKLLTYGAAYLSDAELLAILLGTGLPGKTALDLARELLKKFGSLKKIIAAEAKLLQIPGVGTAKYALITAAIELAARATRPPCTRGTRMASSITAKRFLLQKLSNYQHEVFACIFLDTHQRLLAFEKLFSGTIHETCVYPREVIKRALTHNAAKIIISHNHPSGDPTPSESDYAITLLLKEALLTMDIILVDHIIVGHHCTVSLAERGGLLASKD